MPDSDSILETVARLADEFMERCRAGEAPTIQEYMDRYPNHARQIEELFPALAIMVIVLGGMIGTIIIAMFLPLVEMINSLNAG